MQTDTISLLCECNAGIKMGESAINQTLPHAKSEELRHILEVCKNTHAVLGDETHRMLLELGGDTKPAHPIARAMSGAKICTRMMVDESDRAIASLMTDGCNMGIKSLARYLNKYGAASLESRDIARRLILSEEFLEKKLRVFL